MTEVYDHQWPQAQCDPRAVQMHWGHSILKEVNFTSPWSAVERATELAWELGVPCSVRIDSLTLPSQRGKKKNGQKVTFEDCDNSFDGSVELKEFLPDVKHLEDDRMATQAAT